MSCIYCGYFYCICGEVQYRRPMIKEDKALGAWLSAALDDDKVCPEMKRDILAWMNTIAFPYNKANDDWSEAHD